MKIRNEEFEKAVYSSCKTSDRIFVLNPSYRRANFYSQQLRTLSLIRQIFERGKLVPGKPGHTEFTIVGGGISGLTAAAAALTGGVNVTLIEKNDYLSSYTEAVHRELHPNLAAWPFQPLRAITDLPFLNWACSPAPKVVTQILRQWTEFFEPHVNPLRDTVTDLNEDGNSVEVLCENGTKLLCDIVFVATGFDREENCGKDQSPSYWRPQSYEPPDAVSISGSGDGGLIDAAYQHFGLKTVAASRFLAYLLDNKPHKSQIFAAENEALGLLNDASNVNAELSAHERLGEFYNKLTIASEDLKALETYKRSKPIPAQHFFEKPTAFSPTTSPINKALFSVLIRPPSAPITSQQGNLKATDREPFKIVAECNDGDLELDSSRVIVRHGVSHAAWTLLGNDHKTTLESSDARHLTKIVPDEYDPIFFVEEPERKVAPSTTYNPHHFFDCASQQLSDLLETITDGQSYNVSVERKRGEHWKVRPRNVLKRDITIYFPIQIESHIIEVSDEVESDFNIVE